MMTMLFIWFTRNHSPENRFSGHGIRSKNYSCFPCCVDISHILWVCCVIVMKYTVQVVQVLKVCKTVTPSLVFHTGGMFVILINVSIFRMSTEKKEKFIHFETVLRYLSRRSVFDFSVTFKLT